MSLVKFYLIGIYVLTKEKRQNEKSAAGLAVTLFSFVISPLLPLIVHIFNKTFSSFSKFSSNPNNQDVYFILTGLIIYGLFITTYGKLTNVILSHDGLDKIKLTGWDKTIIRGTFPILVIITALVIRLFPL